MRKLFPFSTCHAACRHDSNGAVLAANDDSSGFWYGARTQAVKLPLVAGKELARTPH